MMNGVSKWIAFAFVLMGLGIFLWVYIEKESSRNISSLSVDLKEAKKALTKHCREMTNQLAEQGIANSFSEVVYNLHEPKLEKEPILRELPKCFSIEPSSTRIAEVAIFSSDDFASSTAEKVGDIQFQISVLDKVTRNKLAEAAFFIGGTQ
jgi:hypothetical protein